MKRTILASLLLLSFTVSSSVAQRVTTPQSSPAAAVPARQAIEIPIVTKTLANGLEVIVLADNSIPLVTVEMAVRNGSFTEPPELNGLSHLYEHMFFKTNRASSLYWCDRFQSVRRTDLYMKYGCEETVKLRPVLGDVSYLGNLDKIGRLPNGTTQEEYVNYFFTATSGGLDILMRSMRDSMLFPAFDENEFAKEIQVVLGELDRQMSEPFYYLDRTLMDKLFYKYPSRKSPGGTRATVASATTEKMRLIQSRYYVPNNAALIVTGDVDPQNVFTLAENLFGTWKRSEDPFKKFPLVEHPQLQKNEGVIVRKDVENVLVQIGWHGPSIGKDDESTYAADVFSYIIEQPNSRFQRAMIDSGLVAAVDLHYYTQRNVGPIRVTLVTSPEKAKAALKALYSEMARFNDVDYFSDEELASAKNLIEAQDLFSREKLSEYSHTLGFWWSSTGIDYFRGYHKNLRAVNRESIKRYISTYILGKPHVGVALISDADLVKSGLTEKDLIGQ